MWIDKNELNKNELAKIYPNSLLGTISYFILFNHYNNPIINYYYPNFMEKGTQAHGS